ncbi:MAG: M16 family metallopeptidase, partial [Bryobacteraceae bacterium]
MLALVATLLAQLPPGVTRFTSVEGITEYRLANGLRVLLFPDPTKQTITVNITYLVGSRHENYGETGMAHLLEHLLFKGSARHKDIPKELSDHGTRPNGTTWLDRTNYYETFQATDANLEWALDLESDRMVNSFVARKDLDSEMTVVRNEFEAGENDPHGVLFERVVSTAYLWHNYGKSTIGARSDIERVNIERLQAFYKNYYQPDNAVLLVAGKIDEPKTLALVHKYFSPIPRPTRMIQPTYTDEPAQDGERFVTLRRVGDVQALIAAYHVPPGAHDDFPAIFLAGQALTTVPAGRLYKALVEAKKAATVGGFTFALKEPGLMMFDAAVRKESSIDEARNAMLATLDGIKASPFTAEEVERVRTQSLKNIELTVNSSERFGLTLSEWIAQGDWRLFFLQRDRLRKVTTEQVQAAALKYLKANNRTVGVYIPTAQPERVDIPAAPDVSALVKDYKGDVQISQGEAFDPSPSNIDARTRRGEVAGIKIAYLSKQTRCDTVNAT